MDRHTRPPPSQQQRTTHRTIRVTLLLLLLLFLPQTIHHRGLLYTTMCEFFGQHELRMPSIYWAIIATHPGSGLCKAARKKWGFIASADGLGLAYPVIAAKHDGGALVVYAYAGSDQLPSSLGPAHPGKTLDACCQDCSTASSTAGSTVTPGDPYFFTAGGTAVAPADQLYQRLTN